MYIGIDLGTSNSAIAGVSDGEARVFRPADGGEVLPSVIYIDKRGHRLYGRRAHDQALIAPENVASGFKRLMGTSTPIEIKGAGLTLSPEECSAEIIRQLLGQATTETGEEDFTGAIVTIPAAFNQMQSEATLRAAKLAGLERVDLLQEPVAAALASMAGAKRSGQFLIYDLGGGTFDVALAEALNGEVTIVAQQGINMLGGRDFDRMIVNEIIRPWLIANFDLPDNFQRDPAYRRLIRIAHLAAEKAKIDLSTLEEASIFASDDEVRLMDQSEAEIFLDAPVTRAQFEELIREPVMQTVNMIRAMLEENNYNREDIDRIVFIGGPTRTPLVRQIVSEELGIAADLKTDPMTAVAAGAAYYCESRRWELAGIEAPGSGSVPKPKQAETPAPEDPGLTFSYDQRTTDDKTVITVHLAQQPGQQRQVRLTAEGWDSGVLPLTDGLTVMVKLPSLGTHNFDVRVLDESGQHLSQHDHTLTITRAAAAAGAIPAAQTVAIKALEKPDAKENILLPLIKKGAALPASGQVNLKAGRDLKSGGTGAISFELFQVEYPERVDLNLCVGLFRIEGHDLPAGQVIRAGDPVVFEWRMNEGGILQASVRLPANALDLRVPRFYAPQAGEMSFDRKTGLSFAAAVLKRGDDEWGDLAAALGPDGGPEVELMKTRLQEQHEVLDENPDDAEAVRRVVEETRFIRQDIVRLGKKYNGPLLQRQLGKMIAAYNRVVRGRAEEEESGRFDAYARDIQKIIDENDGESFDVGALRLGEMRSLFFAVAWRDPDYVLTWFRRLSKEPYLFPDQNEFKAMAAEGEKLRAKGDQPGLRALVERMLDARIALGANDAVNELATIVKT
ncbi:MAG: Hsp70 family protein [Alphaproteobacteria bacterium]|nr:Hsp70 family protein [Alphaproteobacteria bacterium]